MKKSFPPPLTIHCDDLSQKLINELADRLSLHFFDVDILGNTIFAKKPVNAFHYEKAWQILDNFAVKVA